MKSTQTIQNSQTDPVYLSAMAISSLTQTLPTGTGYFITIVLIAMMSGRLMQHKGSLARAVLPFVIHLKWGWHRVERAMERGKFSLDGMIERGYQWCIRNLEVEKVRLGSQQREVFSLDTSTIARLRCTVGKAELLGKGYCHTMGRAVRANIVGAVVSVVKIKGIRTPLLRCLRYGKSSEAAVEKLFQEIPKISDNCLIIVDAGIATKVQFSTSNKRQALLGRLRRNCKLRCAPPPPVKGKRGAKTKHGLVLHPGCSKPEVKPDEDFKILVEQRQIRVRRWNNLHYEGFHETKLDLLRIDDPAYKNPLIVATSAQGELSTAEFLQAYPHRWPVETLFFIGEETTATEKPRAWTKLAVERRIGLGLLTASLLKAISAMGQPLAMGPWDLNAKPSAGRLANHLDIHLANLLPLALNQAEPRNYQKIQKTAQTKNLRSSNAA